MFISIKKNASLSDFFIVPFVKLVVPNFSLQTNFRMLIVFVNGALINSDAMSKLTKLYLNQIIPLEFLQFSINLLQILLCHNRVCW